MKNELIEVLMNRDEMTEQEALDELALMRERVIEDFEDPEEVLYEYGLEPDYIFDLLW